jgi:lambda repressor-like predicted transcriptional regulator
MLARERAKESLKRKGWSYRKVAPSLGVHWTHLARVLTGKRDSRRLLRAIEGLPKYKVAA